MSYWHGKSDLAEDNRVFRPFLGKAGGGVRRSWLWPEVRAFAGLTIHGTDRSGYALWPLRYRAGLARQHLRRLHGASRFPAILWSPPGFPFR